MSLSRKYLKKIQSIFCPLRGQKSKIFNKKQQRAYFLPLLLKWKLIALSINFNGILSSNWRQKEAQSEPFFNRY
tara:strand:+ start:175 stop:396 length:222 start_codon:yes stop_codon:yes gene_type:complete